MILNLCGVGHSSWYNEDLAYTGVEGRPQNKDKDSEWLGEERRGKESIKSPENKNPH